MKIKQKNILKKISILLSVGVMESAIAFNFSSCSSQPGIYVGNFESYMSPDLMKKYEEEYNMNFLYYSNDDDVLNKFADNYDIAFPSFWAFGVLMKKGMLKQINYDDMPDDIYLPQSNDIDNKVHCGKDLEKLVSSASDTNSLIDGKEIIEKMDEISLPFSISGQVGLNLYPKKYQEKLKDKYGVDWIHHASVLDFGIPYFIQNMVFAYKCDETHPNQISFPDQSVSSLLNTISPTGNNYDTRFNPNQKNKIAIVDDIRTQFSISKINYDEQNNTPIVNINPSGSNNKINYYSNIYNSTREIFPKNYDNLYFNSDGNELSGYFFDNKNICSGLLAYNGDIMYGATGMGDIEIEKTMADKFTANGTNHDGTVPNNFYGAFNFQNSPIYIDFLCFNNKNDGKKMERCYKFAYDLTLKGVDYNPEYNPAFNTGASIDKPNFWDPESIGSNNPKTWEENDEQGYYFDSCENMVWNGYSSIWKTVNDYVNGVDCEDIHGNQIQVSYFEDLLYEVLKEVYGDDWHWDDVIPQSWIDYLKTIYECHVYQNSEVNENPISDLDRSNMHWAYEKYKNSF